MYQTADPTERRSDDRTAPSVDGGDDQATAQENLEAQQGLSVALNMIPADKPPQERVGSGTFTANHEYGNGLEFLNGFEITTAPAPGAGISDDAKPEERIDYMANPENRLSADVNTLWDKNNRVLAIGDQHITLDIKQHTIDNMRAYKEAGAEGIGMEFLPISSQADLDRYFELRRPGSTATPEQWKEARETVENLFRQAQESPGDSEKDRQRAEPAITRMMAVLDAAVAAGIRPVAIEPDISRSFAADGGYSLMHAGMRKLDASSQTAFDTYINPNSSAEDRETAKQTIQEKLKDWGQSNEFFKALDQAREAGLNFNDMKLPREMEEEQDTAWLRSLHDNRNQTWAKQTAQFLSQSDNPNARLLLFGGSQHFQYEQRSGLAIASANERLKEHGIGTTVLQFAGGDFARDGNFETELSDLSKFYAEQNGLERDPGTGEYPWPPDREQSAGLRYTKQAEAAKVSGELFAIRIAPNGPREADYVIHLPQ